MIEFTVLGIPIPQGSMKAFMRKGKKFPILTSDNSKTMPWREQIGWACLRARGESSPAGRNVALTVEAKFFFPKPQSEKRKQKVTKPDIDKLCRCLLDGLTGIAFEDDSQVVGILATKEFGDPPRMEVKIEDIAGKPLNYCAGSVDFQHLPF